MGREGGVFDSEVQDGWTYAKVYMLSMLKPINNKLLQTGHLKHKPKPPQPNPNPTNTQLNQRLPHLTLNKDPNRITLLIMSLQTTP